MIDKLKHYIKKYGWRAFAGIFVYYLVRDLTLYVFIPYFIVSKIQAH